MATAHITEILEHLAETADSRLKKNSRGDYWPMCKLNSDCCGACEDIKRRVTDWSKPAVPVGQMTPKQIDRELARLARRLPDTDL